MGRMKSRAGNEFASKYQGQFHQTILDAATNAVHAAANRYYEEAFLHYGETAQYLAWNDPKGVAFLADLRKFILAAFREGPSNY